MGMPKLTPAKVARIKGIIELDRRLRRAGGNKRGTNHLQASLAREFGVSPITIGAIAMCRRWKEVEPSRPAHILVNSS